VSRIPVISDAQPSADEQLRHRRRAYTVIMAIHIVGFAVGASLYELAWWAGLVILIVTGPLQWIAVVIANAAPRSCSRDRRHHRRDARRARARLAGRRGGRKHVPPARAPSAHAGHASYPVISTRADAVLPNPIALAGRHGRRIGA